MDDVEGRMKASHKKRVKYGYMMALFCAILWALWYIPGTYIWEFDIVGEFMAIAADKAGDENLSFIIAAIMITALNAAFVLLAYGIWNACLGKAKFSEMKRSIRELRCCTKYYFFGAVCGGPIAILGSFLAMGYIGGAFAAVAALAYPVIGTILSRVWLGQKISHRAIMGIIIILIGSFTIFGIRLISDIQNPLTDVPVIGYIGGIMALCGWGIEGAVAAKGIDVSEPDIAITLRFGMENIIWWVIAIPILAVLSFPVYQYMWEMLTSPVILLTLVMLGLTFGFCYVTWYKAFPLIGVGRGQGIGSLYGVLSVIFLVMFFGVAIGLGGETLDLQLSLVGGAILCTVGTLVMFTEKGDLDSLRDTAGKKKDKEEEP